MTVLSDTNISAFLGSLFLERTEPCYAFLSLAGTAGFAVSFSISQIACTNVKIYLVLVLLVLAICGYYATEIITRKKSGYAQPSAHKDCTNDADQVWFYHNHCHPQILFSSYWNTHDCNRYGYLSIVARFTTSYINAEYYLIIMHAYVVYTLSFCALVDCVCIHTNFPEDKIITLVAQLLHGETILKTMCYIEPIYQQRKASKTRACCAHWLDLASAFVF